MPSKIYSHDDEARISNAGSTKSSSKKKVSSDSDFVSKEKGVGKKKGASKQSAYSPFIFPDEVGSIDESAYNDVLVDDGHIHAKSVHVVRSGSKVSTEFSKSKISREDYDSEKTHIGKKHAHNGASGLHNLRSQFGFNFQNFSQKLVVVVAALAIFSIVLLSIGSTWMVRLWNNTPELEAKPFESSVVYARDGVTELFKYYKEERREVVDLCTSEQEADLAVAPNCIPKKVQLAAIALEDENFNYNADGIPWSNIAGAAFECLRSAGGTCRGGSGLSQQLVKNVTKQDDFSVERKITELLTAIKLNDEITKPEILYLYLNQVSFGRNAYGVQEAAKSYFGKNVKDLNHAESCYIAALTQKPTTFSSSIGQPESADWIEFEGRKEVCLNKLHELQLEGSGIQPLLDDAQLLEAQNTEVAFQPNESIYPFPHFKDFVTEELQKFRLTEQALATQGYKIVTTLDPAIQRRTEETIKAMEQQSVINNGANNVAALVLDGPTGEIIAMVGSRDYNDTSIDGQVNIVTSSQQPGSSIKPYVYAAALNEGFNPGTVLMDVPTTFEGGFRPKNYSGGFVGAVNIRGALQNSYNIPAVKAAYLAAGEGDLPNGQAGITKVFNFSEAMGVRYPCIEGAFNNNPVFEGGGEKCTVGGAITPEIRKDAYRSRCYVSASIGGCETTMLSHATGINTFAQEGNLRTATPFLSIVNTQTGRDIYKENAEGANPIYPRVDQVIDPLIARQVGTILSDYQTRYRAFGRQLASNLELDGWVGDNAVAAKTGTTDQVRDTWTVGYTPYYTTTVWVGNTDNSPMRDNASSSSAPAPIWKAIMTFLHEGKEPKGVSREGLQQVRLNPASGFPVETGGYVEWLTPNQIEALGKAQAILAKPEFDPTKSSIFTNRSSIVTRRVKVNTQDGKLADEKLTLPSNISEEVCTDSLSEFPLDPAWLAGVNLNRGCPSEATDQDQIADQTNIPKITTNLKPPNTFDSEIVVNAQVAGNPNKTIKGIQIFIDGTAVAGIENAPQLSYTIPANLVGSRAIRIIVIDSWGIPNELTISSAVLSE